MKFHGINQVSKSQSVSFGHMKRILVLLLLALFSTSVSAESYIITGQVTYSDNSPVGARDIAIDCNNDQYYCSQYKGISAMTDINGVYTIILEVDSEENNTVVLLSILGEDFPHTIDLGAKEQSPDGRMYQDIKLEQKPSTSAMSFALGCCLLLFGLMGISVLFKTGRMLSTRDGRAYFAGHRPPRTVECLVCNKSIVQHELVKHMMVEHNMEAMEAGESAGLAMRKTWSKE